MHTLKYLNIIPLKYLLLSLKGKYSSKRIAYYTLVYKNIFNLQTFNFFLFKKIVHSYFNKGVKSNHCILS